ncbi:phosphonatase-like hydrolase [Pedobacter ginsengiterrae]
MENISMVVFDMAGTTVNEDNLVYKTLLKVINDAGFELNLEQVLELGAGKEKRQAIRSLIDNFYAEKNEDVISKIYEHFIVELTNAYKEEAILPQPNVIEVFFQLKQKGIITVLNTGYDRKTAQAIIDKLGWQEGIEFDGLVTASDVEHNRPDPDMIFFAMKRFNIKDSESVIKVGDSTIDILEGKNAGCGMSIGITTGAHSAEQLEKANPDKVINDLAELMIMLEKREHSAY